MPNVLFICTGNVCRSPMAEGLFRRATRDLDDFQCASAGLSAADGQPPSRHSIEVMKEKSIDITGQRSQMLSPEVVAWASHIFAMTQGHKEGVEMLFPQAAEKTFLLREFLGSASPDDIQHGLLDVPDPIGLDKNAYLMTREMIAEAIPPILDFLKETNR